MINALLLLQHIPESIPLTYAMHHDNLITSILLVSFLLSAAAISGNQKYLIQQGKDFFLNRTRTSIFSNATSVNATCSIILIVQACIMIAIYLFKLFETQEINLISTETAHRRLLYYIVICVVFVLFKYSAYTAISWIFSEKNRAKSWIESYSLIIYYSGIILFIVNLFHIYLNSNYHFSLIIGILLLFFIKILIFYKEIKIFFHDISTIFLLILYFCALEMIPYLTIYQGLRHLNYLL